MTNTTERTGADFTDDHVRLAQVKYSSGRPVVSDMRTLANGSANDSEPYSHIVVGIPGECVIAKQIHISEFLTVEPRDAALHELLLSFMESHNDYLHDLIATDSANHWLGFALKRECAEELSQRIVAGGLRTGEHVQYAPRSVALGKAVMTFAIGSRDDFFVAVEIDDSSATLCFLQGGKIVDVGLCPFSHTDWSDTGSVSMAMRDVRTVISLHQSRLFGQGVTTPLTQIALCGTQASEKSRKSLERFYTGQISILRLNAGYFANPAQASEPTAHRYLVTLGLALE
jgi:hypothetical protein